MSRFAKNLHSKKDWRIFWTNGRLGSIWYENKNFPNVALIRVRVSGVLYPYCFAIGKFSTSHDQRIKVFEGHHSSKYNGMNATQETDFFANKLQKEYEETNGETKQ
jgi:hypothetical protein|tara:strand:- start:165 stop:482 length:318 start_codon:yes stop_codon:yes gene_type:complete